MSAATQRRETTVKRIGIISDTHGLIRPEAMDALQGSDLILHAGDIGTPDVIEFLRRIAPVCAVRGNVDGETGNVIFPETQVVEVEGHCLYVLHDLSQLDLDPAAADFRAVIFGHSHQPSVSTRGGVLYVNPGSAGPRRFRLPVTLAKLTVGAEELEAEIVHLQD